jgi:hypothetical protein
MQAPGLADVLVREAQPAMATGLGDHRLEQAAIRLLDVGAAAELDTGVTQARGKRIAYALEIAEAEYARAAGGAHTPIEALARKGLGEDAAELGLQAGDLTAQVAARRTTVSDGR